MRKVLYRLFFIGIMALYSCKPLVHKDINLTKLDSFEIKINSLFYVQEYFDENGSKLFYLDVNSDEFYQYSLDSFKLIDSINLMEFNALKEAKGLISKFYVNKKDDIFLLSAKLQKVYRLNSGSVTTYIIPKPKNKEIFIGSKWFHVIDSTIFVNGYIYQPTDVDVLNFQELQMSILNDSIVSLLNNTPIFPKIYSDGKYYNDLSENNISKCFNNKNESLYSFPIDHNIQLYNNKNGFAESFNAKSDYIDSFYTTPLAKKLDIQYTMIAYITAPFYKKIVFDKYRNLYYRIADHALPIENDNGKLPLLRNKSWSLIVLDSNFHKLNEFVFSYGDYLPDIMPIKSGLLMAKGIPNEKTKVTNSLNLDLYEIK